MCYKNKKNHIHSLNRINPKKEYVKGNILVVSYIFKKLKQILA